jgi:hypothetical protein
MMYITGSYSTELHSKFIHYAVRLLTAPKPLPKRVLQYSSFNFQYPLVSLSLLTLLPLTSITPPIFPSIMFYKEVPTQHLTNLLFLLYA